MSIRLLLADDHPAYRHVLRQLLEREPGLHVVGEAGNGQTALEMAHELAPDIVLMDVEMPLVNGLEGTRRIVAALPEVRVLALSMHAEAPFVDAMFEAGARGYALKDSDVSELVRAVRLVAGGGIYRNALLDGTPDSQDGDGP